jgi:hypothetical protein
VLLLTQKDQSVTGSWPLDILPLVQGLAQQKPIAHGLLIGADCTDERWLTAQVGIWQAIDLPALHDLPFSIRYDLAVLALPEQVDENATHSITRLRDLLARRVLVLAHPNQLQLLRALGFSQIEDLGECQLWQFNILEYKQVPDWLNAKYWANPENWGKYRW